MSNNLDFILHPNKENIMKNFFNENNLELNQNIEHFFEGPQGELGEAGIRGLRGDRGLRGSEGPAGIEGPPGEGITESELISRSLWCVTENQCQTPKNIIARFRDDSYVKVGPNSSGNKALILGGKNNETGEAGMYTTYGDLYIDTANADEGGINPGNLYINKNSKGKTYINDDGSYTLLNDKSGYVGVNMQGSNPQNNLHIKGDRPVTIENTAQTGTSGLKLKDSKSNQDWTMGLGDLGLYFYDNKSDKYSLVTKDGSTGIGIGSNTPNKNFALDVGEHARFSKDVRLTGGSDASVQINLNKNEGNRDTFESINQGIELVGGGPDASNINFYGNKLNVNNSTSTLLSFTREGIEFIGPMNFQDTVTMTGPKKNDENNIGLQIDNDALFQGNTYHTGKSYWGEEKSDELWTRINTQQVQTNNGIKFFSKDNKGETVVTYDNNKIINNGEELMDTKITKGALIIQDNLIVEGKGEGDIKGIQTNMIKTAKLQSDQIRTFSQINFSDIRLKENIKLINPQENINKLMKFNGYEYTNKITHNKDKGVIAQQIEPIDPDLVDNNNKYKGVKYDNIIPMLIEGIKYQQKEINELKNKNKIC